MQTPLSHCDCCGLPISSYSEEDCPRCGYPVNVSKEEQFLTLSIRDLQRVATYGGANLTVTGLIRRYQARLNYLRQQKMTAVPAQEVQKSPQAAQPGVSDKAAIPPVSEQVIPVNLFAPPVKEQAAIASPFAASAGEQAAALPVQPGQPAAPRQPFSLRSFFADQAITIVASLGAFLILIGALSFVVNTPNFLLSFLLIFGVQALFGIIGVVAYRFPNLRVVARIYTGIFTLLVPLTGFAAYGLIQGNYVQLSVPLLIAIAAAYAAIVYGALAIYQRFALFGYLGAMAIVVVDLAIARNFNLDYWWWPSMLMILALAALVSQLQPAEDSPSPILRLFTGPRAVLRDPVRVLMFVIVVTSVFATPITTLYSLGLDSVHSSNEAVRFSILSMTSLLLIWMSLSLWLTKRTRDMALLPYMFLSCVLAFCYALDFHQVGYALALTLVALLYHSLNRFAPRLLQPFGRLGLQLDIIALVLVGIVPVISFPLFPFQLVSRAYHMAPLGSSIQFSWETVIELLAVGLGLVLTVSIILSRTGLHRLPGSPRTIWPWLLLLSGLLLNWEYGVVVLALNVEPVWYFLGLTLLLVAVTVVVRQRFGPLWANPLDVLVLGEISGTLVLGLAQAVDSISTLLLFFAVLTYGVLLYQRRPIPLFIPLILALLALPFLLSRPRELLLMSILLPLASVAIRRLLSERWVTASAGDASQPKRSMPWEWPLIAIGLLCGVVITLNDLGANESVIQGWVNVPFPVAIEIASLSFAWYVSAGLARVKIWLLPVVGFALAAVLFPSNSFGVLAAVTPVAALLGLGISRLAGRDWASPLYSVALLGAIVTGFMGQAQGYLAVTTWILLGFALLAYIIGLLEDTTWVLWLAPVFAIWSVLDSALLGDLYRPPTVALICAVLGVAIGCLKWFTLPFIGKVQQNRLLRYALPFYATALAGAILTGYYGTVFGINKPFYAAIPDILLVYAAVAFGVVFFERRPIWLGLVAGFATWGTLLATQTTAYYVAGIGLGLGMVGLLVGRFLQPAMGNIATLTPMQSLARFTWNWPWYLAALIAAIVISSWPALPLTQPVPGFIVWSLVAFMLVAVAVMLVERTPELLVVPVALASWAIWQWQPPLDVASKAVAYSLLCVLIFASQFVWRIIPSAIKGLQPTTLHRLLGLGGQALVVLAVIGQNGLSADSGWLVHVGAGSLLVLALLLFCYGRLQPKVAMQHWCGYGVGFLASLVIPWELSAFRQTNLSLLTLAPATYLLVIAPIVVRDEVLPDRHRMGQIVSILGAALLLLPTLWLSFSESNSNLLYTLLLMGESLALLILGFVTRLRIFILTGAGLVVIAALRALFLPSLGIPTGLALAVLGGILLAVATALSMTRRRLQAAWTHWE